MAQVIKYKSGGSTSKKYGTYTIDGNKIEVDDDFLNQITKYGNTLDSDVSYQFGKIVDTLRSGEDVSYNSNTNEISGNIKFDVSKKQNERLRYRRKGLGRVFGGIWKGDEEDARNAMYALKNFTYNKPAPIGTDYDWSKELTIEYEKDEDGKYKRVNGNRVFINGANNIKILNRLSHLQDILNYGDNDTFKGFGSLKKEDYINLYNNWGPTEIARLQEAIKNGTLSDSDIEAINDIGILLGKEPTDKEIEEQRIREEDPALKAEIEAKQRYKNAGVDYEARNIFNVDDKGNVTIIDPTLQQKIGNGDAWLNDEFRRENDSYASYIPEGTGLFVIDGRVYKGSDQDALSKIQKYLDFVKENRATAGNSDDIKQYWKENEYSGWSPLDRDSNGMHLYSSVFSPGDVGRDMSGYYVREKNDPYVFDYFPGYNAENDELFDQFGHPLRTKVKRVLIDPVSKTLIPENDPRYNNLKAQTDEEAIQSYYDNPTNTIFSPYYNIENVGEFARVLNYSDPNNPNTGYSIYYKPDSDLYYWYDENPGGENYTLNSVLSSDDKKMRDYIWNIDPQLGKYLTEHPEVLRDVNVKNSISGFIRNPYLANISGRRVEPEDFPEIEENYPVLAQILANLYNTGVNIGNPSQRYSSQSANETLREITDPKSLANRGLAYRIDQLRQVPYQKKGGVLKFQIGGVNASKSKTIKASQDNIRESYSNLRSAGEEKVIGDGTDLTAADWAEIVALVGDSASLGATFIPGLGNIASAAVGAGGSLAGFASDVARDGAQPEDFGSLLLNLGLDAGTLIPGIGTWAKANKIVKALKNSKAVMKLIKGAAYGLNLGQSQAAITTALNNIQDDKWTIKDVRTVLNGLRGAANFNRIKGTAKKEDVVGNTVTLKPKSRNLPEVQLNRSEIESIEGASKTERPDKLTTLIKGKLPEGTNTDQVQDLLGEYGIERSNTSNWSWRHPFTFGQVGTVSTNQFNYDVIPGEYRNPSKTNWWNRRAAIRDAKVNRSNPYFKDYAIEKTTRAWSEPFERVDADGIKRSYRYYWDITGNWKAPITTPIYSNFIPYRDNSPEQREHYNPDDRPIFYKKGGKVIKAYNGFLLTPKIDTYNSSLEIPKLPKELFKSEASYTNIGNDLFNKHFNDPSVINEGQINPVFVTAKRPQETSTDSETESLYGHGPKLKRFGFNPDMPLGVADFLISSRGINRANQKAKDAILKGMLGSQQQMPTEFYSRFSDNGLHRMYADRINNMRQYKTITSDPNQVMVERLLRDTNVDQMENERDTKFSQMVDQYNDKLLGQKQQYANLRTQITNENKKNWYSGLAQLDMADANKITQQTQNVKNLIYQFRTNLGKDMVRRNQIEEKLNQLNANTKSQNELKKLFEELGGFAAMSEEDKNRFGNDWQSYLAYKVPDRVASITNNNLFDFYQDQANNPLYNYSWWRWFRKLNVDRFKVKPTPTLPKRVTKIHKKGGTIRRYRDVGEQAYLDQQKAINKAVNDLNNNIIKLFSKMMS